MKSIKLLLLAFVLVATSFSAVAQEVAPAIARDSKIERRVEKILKGMTLEEKVGQMAELNIDKFGASVPQVDKKFVLREEVSRPNCRTIQIWFGAQCPWQGSHRRGMERDNPQD